MLKIGDKVSRVIEVTDLTKEGRFNSRKETRTGIVVYVHPLGRYYEVEFDIATGGKWRETFYPAGREILK